MTHNPHRIARETFIRKWFSYPATLVEAVRSTGAQQMMLLQLAGNPLHQLRKFDNPGRLVKVLDTVGFHQHMSWYYPYLERYAVSDYCGLQWARGEGLFVHFESLDVTDTYGEVRDVDMDQGSWEFLFQQRKLIFSKFLPQLLGKYWRDEDLAARITDKNLHYAGLVYG